MRLHHTNIDRCFCQGYWPGQFLSQWILLICVNHHASRYLSHILLLRASLVYPPLFSLYHSSNEKSSPSAASLPCSRLPFESREPGQVRTLSRLRQIEHSVACMHLRSKLAKLFSGSHLYSTTQMQEWRVRKRGAPAYGYDRVISGSIFLLHVI